MGSSLSRGVASLVLVGLLAPATAHGFCRMSTAPAPVGCSECVLCEEDDPSADCRYLAWQRRCLSIAIDERGARDFSMAELRSIVQSSYQPWLDVTCDGASPGFEVHLLDEVSACPMAEYNEDGGNANAIVFIDDWEEDPSAYALTTVWHSRRTGEIYDADMEINQDSCAMGRCLYTICPDREGCTDRTVDLQNVLTHEFGHVFGMGHTTESFATMHCMSPPGEVAKRILRTDDIEGFCTAYPPGSLSDACDFEPRGGLSLVCGGDTGCGCDVPGGPEGGHGPWLLAGLIALLLRLRRRR